MNDSDLYIKQIVNSHTPDLAFVIEEKINELKPFIHAWANGHAYILKPAGSFAKGTGIIGTSDIDFFISLNPSVGELNTLENVYNTLRNRFSGEGYEVREQNVSLGIEHTGLKIDLVAGVKHHILGLDHSIWKRKAQTWTKTNIDEHIKYVKESGRVFDIKVVKIWRKLKKIDFPSFYLELSVIEALRGQSLLFSSPASNFVTIMDYLATDFVSKTIIDPANSENEISEELTDREKELIQMAALSTLRGSWDQAIY